MPLAVPRQRACQRTRFLPYLSFRYALFPFLRYLLFFSSSFYSFIRHFSFPSLSSLLSFSLSSLSVILFFSLTLRYTFFFFNSLRYPALPLSYFLRQSSFLFLYVIRFFPLSFSSSLLLSRSSTSLFAILFFPRYLSLCLSFP